MHPAQPITLQLDVHGIDWPALIELFRLTHLAGRQGEKIRRAFEKSSVVCFAHEGSKLIGAARALSDFEYHATIYDVVVHPDYQGRAVGTRIMNALLGALPVWRVLLIADGKLSRFYERLGFEPYGDAWARLDRNRLYDPA